MACCDERQSGEKRASKLDVINSERPTESVMPVSHAISQRLFMRVVHLFMDKEFDKFEDLLHCDAIRRIASQRHAGLDLDCAHVTEVDAMNILSQLMKNVSGFGTPRYPEAKGPHLDVTQPIGSVHLHYPIGSGDLPIYEPVLVKDDLLYRQTCLEEKLYACGEPGWTYNRHPHRIIGYGLKDHIRRIAKLPYNLAFFNVQTLKMLTNGDGIPTNRFSDPVPGRLNASRYMKCTRPYAQCLAYARWAEASDDDTSRASLRRALLVEAYAPEFLLGAADTGTAADGLAADYADLAIDDNEREDRKLDALLSSKEVVSRGGHIYRYDFEDEGCVQIRVSTVMLSAARVVPSEAAQTKSNSKFKIYNKTRR